MRPSLTVGLWSRPNRAIALPGLFVLVAAMAVQVGFAQEKPQGKTITLGESLSDPHDTPTVSLLDRLDRRGPVPADGNA